MSTLRKALSMTMSFRSRRYKTIEAEEKNYVATPPHLRERVEENEDPAPRPPRFQRGSKMTQSVRDAVGTLRQKLKTSTRRRKRLGDSSDRTPSRRSLRLAGRTPPGRRRSEVPLYEPFNIDTPGKDGLGGPGFIDKDWNFETPTRLKREVESLTANMQALATLSPNTLRENCRARRPKGASPILTNGSLGRKPRPGARKRIETAIF